ncbi:hypothetical protein [Desertivirga arenae]|uniref:hypothetical protein n=1 Tax=Desertivirga arenae TaxID=2810309 RepID=UPI001A95F2AE|nr:hypothetical protein [Pedobacter sp. SYSU D00823]
MRFNVLDKVRVKTIDQSGYISFPYNVGEKVVVTLDGGKDREFFEEELELITEDVIF